MLHLVVVVVFCPVGECGSKAFRWYLYECAESRISTNASSRESPSYRAGGAVKRYGGGGGTSAGGLWRHYTDDSAGLKM